MSAKQEDRRHRPEDRDARHLDTSREWYEYFLSNLEGRLEIPWERGAELTAAETAALASSLPAWQLGETSDGRHLLAAARRYAARQKDPGFIDAVVLFIREEQRHGAELGCYLDLAGIPRARRDWGDSLFRLFRYSIPNLEIWCTVVVMVEVLALIYYHAVQQSSSCPVLRTLCRQILRDEGPHIRFQVQRLAILHRDRSPWLRRLTLAVHRVLFAGIVLAVWTGHHRLLRAGGYHFARYWRQAWLRMRSAWTAMTPSRYAWPQGETCRGRGRRTRNASRSPAAVPTQ